MRRSWICFCLLLFFSGPALAERAERAIADCQAKPNHAASRECLEDAVAASNVAMNSLENEFPKWLLALDEDKAAVTNSVDRFNETQSAFRVYREKQCALHGMMSFGGNSAGDRIAICRLQLNEERSRDLIGILRRGQLKEN